MNLLNEANFEHGFLIDDEVIGGVTPVADDLFVGYMSNHATSETLAYQEFATLTEALTFINSINRSWAYEGVGCSKHVSKVDATIAAAGPGKSGGCAGCSCS